MVTIVANQVLAKATKYNIVSISFQIQAKYMEIVRFVLELDKSRNKITTPFINTISFESFLECAQVAEEELHLVWLEFYSNVVDFVNIFIKFQSHL